MTLVATVPGAGEGQRAGVSQVDHTTGQVSHGGLGGGAGGQSLQFEPRVHTARGRRETSHLSLQLPTHRHHITPPGGRGIMSKGTIDFQSHINKYIWYLSHIGPS